ncbi:MAG: ATP-binding protein [Desulfovibrionaceae bacterium]|nr:ATP-binding protein [Desulfovibrionaceae bacterium]MBR5735044.1 ATP-binding protein [Desulfovibrionaceae bacterium]
MPIFHVPAGAEQLAVVNKFLAEHIPQQYRHLLPKLELAAEELLVNVFSYAYQDGTEGKAEIRLREIFFDGETYLCFSVTDWGKPFNPFADAPTPNLELDAESRPIGGLGIYLIRSVTAHQAYTREENANIIDVYFSKEENGR